MRPWHRHDPDSLPWAEAGDGAKVNRASEALFLLQLDGGAGWEASAGSLLLVSSGQLSVPGLGAVAAGDLAWLPFSQLLETASGATCYLLQIPKGVGPVEPELIRTGCARWQEFDDPHGRPTQPVQVLLDGPLSILRTRFAPEFSAAEHWHDYDTWYFIREGRMRFGHEGWYERGQVRQVTGGYSYGPEEPGDEGVEFVLVSVGGPVALHWADLEPPPGSAPA